MYQCIFTYIHIYLTTCEIQKLTLGVFFSCSPLYLLRQGLLLGPELLSFSQPGHGLFGILCLCLQNIKITAGGHHIGSAGPPYLHNKCFILAAAPALYPPMEA